MNDTTSTLTDDVRAAMTASEGESQTSTEAPVAETATTTTAPAVAEETTSTGDRARDEKGRFKAKEGEAEQPAAETTVTAAPAKPTETVVKPPAAAVETATSAPQVPDATPDLRPPGRWPVAAREAWSKVPPEVRQVIHARERETAVALQRSAKEREYAEKVRETLAPFDGSIRARGQEPLNVVSAYLQMGHRLQYGHPGEKAQMVAGLIKTFGVDIETLAKALDGEAPTGGAQPQSVDPAEIENRVMQRLMAQRQQAEAQRATQEIEAMESDPAYEFLEDVRLDMADLLELAHRRGKQMSVKEAYEKACRQHEDVGRIVSQRAEAAKAKQAPARQVVKEPSSLKGDAPVVQNGARKSGSLRDDVEAALSELSA